MRPGLEETDQGRSGPLTTSETHPCLSIQYFVLGKLSTIVFCTTYGDLNTLYVYVYVAVSTVFTNILSIVYQFITVLYSQYTQTITGHVTRND